MELKEDLKLTGKIITGTNFDKNSGGITFFPGDGYAWFHIDNGPAGTRPIGRLRFSYGGTPGENEVMSILQNGLVGIGTINPRSKLDVAGDINVTGDVKLTGADCAEEFDVKRNEQIDLGTVLVIDEESKLESCEKPYDKKVAGVVSGAGDLKPGLILGRKEGCTDRLPIALMGRVNCKVDADYESIEVGDLLTTSATPGHAMKASDSMRSFGAVIGKALKSLENGRGLIPILVALQ